MVLNSMARSRAVCQPKDQHKVNSRQTYKGFLRVDIRLVLMSANCSAGLSIPLSTHCAHCASRFTLCRGHRGGDLAKEGEVQGKGACAHLHSAHSLVDAPDLLWVQPTRDIHHTNSATDELQHGLPL